MKRVPSREEILAWVQANPQAAGRREIARAFGVKGAERAALRETLREMQAEGLLARERRSYRAAGSPPPVAVLVVEAPDADGDLWARPQHWEGPESAPPIELRPGPKDPAFGPGDRVLARIAPGPDGGWQARPIRRLAAGPRRILGIYRRGERGGWIEPVDRRERHEWLVPAGEAGHARDGELVEAEALGRPGTGAARARVTARLGDPAAPRAVSLIAIHARGIPLDFSEEAEAEAEAAEPVGAEGRDDLRHLPFVTIDPEDARDHDDAVAAEPDPDPANPGGWIVWVAIADVAAYVRPGSALDREARLRGNSTYFPDRVVPMLPERLSGDLCSLHAGVDRPCIAVRMVLSEAGALRGQSFRRGVMRSRAALTYDQVQAARDGRPDAVTAPLADAVIAPLYGAYAAAARARAARAPLDLDLPERQVVLSERGEVQAVTFRARLEAHRLIEEFMILANVAAARTLEARRRPFLYRVHEPPSADKLAALAEQAEACGLAFAPGQVVRTALFNRLLQQAAGKDFAELIHMAVLRTQTQAYYSPRNLGHFGLNLPSYAHFTSPIRRYADLVVHRALIAAHRWGPDGQTEEEAAELARIAEHISFTERRSMDAERDTIDRYLAAFLAERVGATFPGRISGITRVGLFIRLDETGADGLIPVSTLGHEFFHHDPHAQTLTGERSGRVFALGLPVTVRLVEAVPVTGGLLFELVEIAGERAPPHPPLHRGRPGRPPRRGSGKRRVLRRKGTGGG
ncbi:MAG: ribonuclease R [Alphaproteobacteria bacterium]|nr:MAG: ribonuclease R [Alphaproteobacteria bacterium]